MNLDSVGKRGNEDYNEYFERLQGEVREAIASYEKSLPSQDKSNGDKNA